MGGACGWLSELGDWIIEGDEDKVRESWGWRHSSGRTVGFEGRVDAIGRYEGHGEERHYGVEGGGRHQRKCANPGLSSSEGKTCNLLQGGGELWSDIALQESTLILLNSYARSPYPSTPLQESIREPRGCGLRPISARVSE